MEFIFNQQNSLMNNFLAELRDDKIQNDSMRFRRNLERIGEIMAYELSKGMAYDQHDINTPLGKAKCNLIAEQPVIATILRAGMPLHQGVLNYFDQAENAFISAYRKLTSEHDFEIEIEYLSSPSIEGKTLILCDPMLASGGSMVLAYKAMLERGEPAQVHVLSVIASRSGLDYVKEHMPEGTKFWMGAVDATLTDKAYISPGLGDAGDLAYGSKI